MTGQTGIWRYFFQPVDIASLVYFRIAFGAFMLWEVCYYYNRWVQRLWMDPEFHFTSYGFDWIRPWPGGGMYIHFLILGGLAVFIIFGLWYRVSILYRPLLTSRYSANTVSKTVYAQFLLGVHQLLLTNLFYFDEGVHRK